MSLNYPDPAVTNPWFDGNQWWGHDGGGWLLQPNGPSEGGPSEEAITGFKNVLINGDFRVNQRGGTTTPGIGVYGYDRWKGSAGLEQIVEAGNFAVSTEYTLSNDINTASQITSPASGNWSIIVPASVTWVQLERGSVATPFEIRSIQQEIAMCQRYYWRGLPLTNANWGGNSGWYHTIPCAFPVEMRSTPITSYTTADAVYTLTSAPTVTGVSKTGLRILFNNSATSSNINVAFNSAYIEADAEL